MLALGDPRTLHCMVGNVFQRLQHSGLLANPSPLLSRSSHNDPEKTNRYHPPHLSTLVKPDRTLELPPQPVSQLTRRWHFVRSQHYWSPKSQSFQLIVCARRAHDQAQVRAGLSWQADLQGQGRLHVMSPGQADLQVQGRVHVKSPGEHFSNSHEPQSSYFSCDVATARTVPAMPYRLFATCVCASNHHDASV